MPKLSKDFIQDKEILFVGYSSRNNAFSKEIYTAFSNHGIKVYPYNTRIGGNFDMKVYHKLEELPSMPTTAFVLLNKDNTSKAVKELVNHGIKKILFRSKGSVDEALLAECNQVGIETAFGCPLMVYGTGFHKFHAFFAGVK